MPHMRKAAHWRVKECVSGKRATKLNECLALTDTPTQLLALNPDSYFSLL